MADRIAIVEDERLVRELVAVNLRHAGYDIVTAENFEQGGPDAKVALAFGATAWAGGRVVDEVVQLLVQHIGDIRGPGNCRQIGCDRRHHFRTFRTIEFAIADHFNFSYLHFDRCVPKL